MGPDYVKGMCHDIEDPTFDATAVATNARAQVRPIHRPPRMPADRRPHCAWTEIIDETHPPVSGIPALDVVAQTCAATWELKEIDPVDDGLSEYSGALLSDVDFAAFSHSALVRIADEVCLQMHLLNLSFLIAVRVRAADAEQARSIAAKQLTGLVGLAAARIHKALGLPGGADGVLRVLELHPLLNPAGYVAAEFGAGRLHVHRAPAHDDDTWISLCTPGSTEPLQAIATAVDPHAEVRVCGTDTDWTLELLRSETALAEQPEVQLAKVSSGATFEFEPRASLPLIVV